MKKMMSICICFIILICSSVISINAADDEKTVLYLDYGDVSISETAIAGYDADGNSVTEVNSNGYIVTQTNPSTKLERSIVVESGVQSVELSSVNIKRTSEIDYAFAVLDGAEVTVTITGENHLLSGTYRAGFDIAVSAKATIQGDGVLYAESQLEAGIGGGNGKSNGTLTINSGTIYATGGTDGYSAGIGGGSSGKGGSITINGGNIIAVGGEYAAGIGGGNLCSGGTIVINSGTVTATGGTKGAGIGGGFMGNGGTIIINGGSVKGIAGENASNIGNGCNCKTAFAGIVDSNNEAVSLLNLEISNYNEIYVNGINYQPVTCGHPDDNLFYFYAGETEKIITVYTDDSIDFYKFSADGAEEVYPYSDGCERYADKLFVEDAYSLPEGFEIAENSKLVYNETVVDTFSLFIFGDVNFDGKLDGTDAVIVRCVVGNMIDDTLILKLSDADGNGTVDGNDSTFLERKGLSK